MPWLRLHAERIQKVRAPNFEAFRFAGFWYHYRGLPADVQQLADRCFVLMNSNPRHPSIRLKHVGAFWSARVGLHWRAVGTDIEDGISWFWIGSHADYDKLIG